MECPYCEGHDFKEVQEHPYPYHRLDKDKKEMQLIVKYKCSCGYPFFTEFKPVIGWQVYKQGMYQYKG